MPRIAIPLLALTAALTGPVARADHSVSAAWVRAMPPTQDMTAGYLTFENRGESLVTITGATSDASPRVEIHTTMTRDGMQRMQRVESIEVPAGGRVDMAPGGYHLMLRDMPAMPAAGDSVELCLQLGSGESVCSKAAVMRGGKRTDTHQHH